MFGMNRGPVSGWTSPVALDPLALAAAGAALFVWVDRRVAHPTVEVALARNRGFAAAVGAGFLSFLAVAATVLLMPFYFQHVLRLPPTRRGSCSRRGRRRAC